MKDGLDRLLAERGALLEKHLLAQYKALRKEPAAKRLADASEIVIKQ